MFYYYYSLERPWKQLWSSQPDFFI